MHVLRRYGDRVAMGFAAIEGFFEEYYFLSNFSDEGGVQPTVEHWFQAGKAASEDEAAKIMTAPTPGKAKKLGRRCKLRTDWEEIKIEFMRSLLYEKFAEPTIRAKLEATHPRELVECNDWGDDFWGVCTDRGKNVLGQLLEEVRQWYISIT
jgi:ribA/ribD-fused uncharacterized protein